MPDAWNKFLEIARQTRIGVMAGSDVIAMQRGGEELGQLKTPIKDEDLNAVMLTIPGGLLASDAPGLLRCYAIRKRQGLAAITLYEGQACEIRDFGYRGIPRPLGEYRLQPQTEEDLKRRAAQEAAAKYEETLPEQEETAAEARPAKPNHVAAHTPAAAKEETPEEWVKRFAVG